VRKLVPFIAAAPLAVALAAIIAAAGWSANVALVIGTIAVALLISISVPYAFRARQSPSAGENGHHEGNGGKGRIVTINAGNLVIRVDEEAAERSGAYSDSNALDAHLIAPSA
jgi:membrane protein implicated in regulation of membrane protease activity